MEPRIIQLLARKLSGEATAAERMELEDLLTGQSEAHYYAELIHQLWEEEKIREVPATDIAYLRHLTRHRLEFCR